MESKLWQETIKDNGKSSIELHALKDVRTFCVNHDWEYVSPSSREIVCKNCGLGGHIVLGLHILKNGKIVPIQVGVKESDSNSL